METPLRVVLDSKGRLAQLRQLRRDEALLRETVVSRLSGWLDLFFRVSPEECLHRLPADASTVARLAGDQSTGLEQLANHLAGDLQLAGSLANSQKLRHIVPPPVPAFSSSADDTCELRA